MLKDSRVRSEFIDEKAVDFFAVGLRSAEVFPIELGDPGVHGKRRRFAESEQGNAVRHLVSDTLVFVERIPQIPAPLVFERRRPFGV